METEERTSPQVPSGDDGGDRGSDACASADAAVESCMDANSVSAPLLHALPDPEIGNSDVEIESKFVCPCEVDDSLLKGCPPMPLIVQVCASCLNVPSTGRPSGTDSETEHSQRTCLNFF